MLGDYYSTNASNPLLKGALSSVERDRLRERERQARAQRAQQMATQERDVAPLFGAIVKVNPSSNDKVSQQIQSQLGPYDYVRPLLEDSKRTMVLLGSDGIPPSPAPGGATASSGGTASSTTTSSGSGRSSSSSGGNVEFKRPPVSSGHGQHRSSAHASSIHSSAQSRNGFAKPADSKSSSQYSSNGSRGGFYQGQKTVHGASSGASREMSGGSSVKTSYFPRPTSSSSTSSHPARKTNRPTLNFRDLDHHDEPASTPSHADVDNILKEMAEFRVIKPHENLAATPRVEQDSTFSYLFDKVVCPPPKPISPPPPTPAPMQMDSPPPLTPPKNQRISSPPSLIGTSSSSALLLNGSLAGVGGGSSSSSSSSHLQQLHQTHSHAHAPVPKSGGGTLTTATTTATTLVQRGGRHLPASSQPPLPLLEKDLSLSESEDEQKTCEPVPEKSPSMLSQGSTPLSPLPENPIVSPIRGPMSPPPPAAPGTGAPNSSSEDEGDDSASESESDSDSSSAPTSTATPRQPSPPPVPPLAVASSAGPPQALAAEAAEPPRNGWSLKNFFPSTSPHPDKKSSPDDGCSKNKTEDDSENDSEVVCIGSGKKQQPALTTISVSDSDGVQGQTDKVGQPAPMTKRRRSKRRHWQPPNAISSRSGHVTTDSDDCSAERAPVRRPPIYTPPMPIDDSDSDKAVPPPANPRSTNNPAHSSFDEDDDDDDNVNYRFSVGGSRRPPRTPPSPPPPRSNIRSPVKAAAAENKPKPGGSKRGPKTHATASGKLPEKSTAHNKSGTARQRNSKVVEKEEMRVKKKRGRPTKVKPPRTPSESEEDVSPKVKLKSKSSLERSKAHLSSGSDDEWGRSKVRSPRKRRLPANKTPTESRSSDRSTPRDSWEDKRPCRPAGRSRVLAAATSSEDDDDDDDDYGSSRSGPTSSSPVKPVTRVTPAIAVKRPPRDVSPYSSDGGKKEESPPKLDTEANNKKKRDTLMRLFSRNTAEGGGKGGGKGGKGGGKCGGKGGSKTPGVVNNCEVDDGERTPSFRGGTSGTEEPRVPPISPHLNSPSPSPRLTLAPPPPPPPPPKPSPSRRAPSIMCRLDLSSLGGLSALERIIDAKKCSSEEVRTRTELADTRQDMETSSTSSSSKKDRRPQDVKSLKDKRRRSPVPVAAVAPLPNKQHKAPYDVMRLMAPVTPQPKPELGLDVTTTSVPKRERRGSSSSDSSPERIKKPMKRRRGESRHNRGSDLSNVSQTNHERETQQRAPPPPQYGFSYFPPQNDLCDQDNKCNYLNQAKRLKHSADNETDEFSQGLKYLEAVLYFLLTGKTLEQEPESQRAAYHMYKETQQIVRYISSKFVPIKSQLINFNSQTDLHIKLAILSLRCQSLLYLKLYTMKQHEAKDAQRTIGEFLKSNPPPPLDHCLGGGPPGGQGTPSQPMSPTPSPAGSVGSQSSGYSSGAGGGSGLQGVAGQVGGAPHPVMTSLPVTVHAAVGDFYHNYVCLSSAFDLWDQANALISKGNHVEFFTDLDKSCGTLMLETNINQLVEYVHEGINRLKAKANQRL